METGRDQLPDVLHSPLGVVYSRTGPVIPPNKKPSHRCTNCGGGESDPHKESCFRRDLAAGA